MLNMNYNSVFFCARKPDVPVAQQTGEGEVVERKGENGNGDAVGDGVADGQPEGKS
jgi:hypothetical protein